jgi:IrrE N-terminal-like domain
MQYLARAQIEARAAALWRTYGLAVGFDAETLLDTLGLGLLWEGIDEKPGERVLGALRPAARVVVLNENRLPELEESPGLRRFTVAHEVGHWMLHATDERAGTIPLDSAGRTWCRDGSPEQRERQAEMFAASLLAPEDRLRGRLVGIILHGWPAIYRLAEAFGVTPTAMVIRLEEIGLIHRDGAGVPVRGQVRDARQGTLFDAE